MQILKDKIKNSKTTKYMDQIDQDFNFLNKKNKKGGLNE